MSNIISFTKVVFLAGLALYCIGVQSIVSSLSLSVAVSLSNRGYHSEI